MAEKQEILLVGNPNTGKTTLFNSITKSDEKTGNWHGVTVEEKSKDFSFCDKKYSLVDLPGIYSLDGFSMEEEVAIEYLKKHKDKKVINICDINNLERNLYLTLCLLEEGFDVVLAINSTLNKNIRKLSCEKLSKLLGIDVVLVNAKNGEGKKELLQKASQKREAKHCRKRSGSVEDIAGERYEEIENILKNCSEKTKEIYGKSRLDKVLLSRFFSPIIFLAIMGAIFYLTFFLIGKPLSNLLNNLLLVASKPIKNLFINAFGKNFWATYLFDEAIIGGIGTVLSFLPQVVLLFFFLSLLEESGYISRVAFIFDDLLGKVGLSGKSIYSLLLGFGCTGTAILTTKNLENKTSRIKTALVTPFLSCSARLPIFLAIASVFFGECSIFVVISLYVFGIIIALLSSLILNKTLLKSKESSFILEFPPYRMISLKTSLKVLFKNTKSFIFRIGGLLVALNVIVWVLSNFSVTFSFVKFEGESILETFARLIAPIFSPLGFSSWGLIVALLVGIVAKEGVVSTIMLFASGGLANAFMSPTSEIFFASQSGVVSYLVFCLLYVPCISTIAIMHKELGGKWTTFGVAMQLVIAYFVSMLVYLFGRGVSYFGITKVVLFLTILFVIFISIFAVVSFLKKKKCSHCEQCNNGKCLNRKL